MTKTAKTRYEVRHPRTNEVIDTRTSTAGRVYTHAVAVRRSYTYFHALAHAWSKTDVKNAEWSYYNAVNTLAGGKDMFAKREVYEAIVAHGSAEAYSEAMRLARIAQFQREVSEGRFDKLTVEGYQGRADLAQKEHFRCAKQPWFQDVYTIPVTRLA